MEPHPSREIIGLLASFASNYTDKISLPSIKCSDLQKEKKRQGFSVLLQVLDAAFQELLDLSTGSSQGSSKASVCSTAKTPPKPNVMDCPTSALPSPNENYVPDTPELIMDTDRAVAASCWSVPETQDLFKELEVMPPPEKRPLLTLSRKGKQNNQVAPAATCASSSTVWKPAKNKWGVEVSETTASQKQRNARMKQQTLQDSLFSKAKLSGETSRQTTTSGHDETPTRPKLDNPDDFGRWDEVEDDGRKNNPFDCPTCIAIRSNPNMHHLKKAELVKKCSSNRHQLKSVADSPQYPWELQIVDDGLNVTQIGTPLKTRQRRRDALVLRDRAP